MPVKTRRRAIITEILSQQPVPNQDRLQRLLSDRGIAVTQATLSRDLRDLNVFKGPAGYVLNGPAPEPAPSRPEVEEAVRLFMVGCAYAGQLVVVRTRPGHASPLASEIDRSQFAGVVGTIAGDDTVFMAASSPGRARAIHRQLRRIAGLP